MAKRIGSSFARVEIEDLNVQRLNVPNPMNKKSGSEFQV